MRKLLLVAIVAMLATPAVGQDVERDNATVIESGGRSVTFTDEVPMERTGYGSRWHYAHAIRAGDFVYISGIIIGAHGNDTLPISRDRFREHADEVFDTMQRYLATANASLEGVVKINTFHVLDGKNTSLTIDEQALVIAEAKAKYVEEPYPAWTAVGTTGLFSERGIVEIEIVVYAPLNAAADR